MGYLKEIRDNDKIRFFSIIVTTVLISLFCFLFLFSSYSLIRDNINSDNEGLFFWGYKPVVIISESMEPTMKVNGVSIIEKVDTISEINIGDIIMFNTQNEGLVLHRAVSKDGLGIITKGDNNPLEDYWRVTDNDLKGRVVKTYNSVADIMTFLFGDLTDIQINTLLFGFGILVFLLVLLMCFINFLWDYIKVNLFIKAKGVSVITNSLKYQELRVTSEDMSKFLELHNNSEVKVNLIDKIIYKYYVMKLYNMLREEEKVVRKYSKIYDMANKHKNKIVSKNINNTNKNVDKD